MTDPVPPDVPTLVALGTFARADPGGLHGLIRAFRTGDPAAAETVARGVLDAVAASPPLARVRGVVVPVPGHAAGVDDGPRMGLARRLAATCGWLVPEPPPLRRVASVPEAKARPPRDADAETASLRWDDERVERGSVVILLDDVLASGGTIAAAVAAIRRDSIAARDIRVVVVARAD